MQMCVQISCLHIVLMLMSVCTYIQWMWMCILNYDILMDVDANAFNIYHIF